jgi:hypothetical protein
MLSLDQSAHTAMAMDQNVHTVSGDLNALTVNTEPNVPTNALTVPR